MRFPGPDNRGWSAGPEEGRQRRFSAPVAFLGVFLALAGALAGLWLASGQQAEAQEPPLTLADFDATGLDVDCAAALVRPAHRVLQ